MGTATSIITNITITNTALTTANLWVWDQTEMRAGLNDLANGFDDAFWIQGTPLPYEDPDAYLIRARIDAPNERAKALFLSLISPEQRSEFERTGQVTVRARGGRRYLVECRTNRHGNIIELDHQGEHAARLCVAPGGNIPHFDAILGQIVALEHDEQHVREMANFTPLQVNYRRVA